jgi:hypothetical protein
MEVVPELETTKQDVVEFSEDPILERHSHMYGQINLFPPATDPSTWNQYPWKICTKHGLDGINSPGLKYIIKPEYYLWAANHVSVIGPHHLWPML